MKALEQHANREHIFVDEAWVCSANDSDQETIAFLSRQKESALRKCLWIAFRPEEATHVFEGERQLGKVFRNQPNIVKYLNRNGRQEANQADCNNPLVTTILYKR